MTDYYVPAVMEELDDSSEGKVSTSDEEESDDAPGIDNDPDFVPDPVTLPNYIPEGSDFAPVLTLRVTKDQCTKAAISHSYTLVDSDSIHALLKREHISVLVPSFPSGDDYGVQTTYPPSRIVYYAFITATEDYQLRNSWKYQVPLYNRRIHFITLMTQLFERMISGISHGPSFLIKIVDGKLAQFDPADKWLFQRRLWNFPGAYTRRDHDPLRPVDKK